MAMSRSRITVIASLGVLFGLALIWLFQDWWPDRSRQALPAPLLLSPSVPAIAPIDADAIRAQAWAKVASRLDAADQASKAEIENSIAMIDEFFASRRPGVRPFAQAVLSMNGKWRFVKSKLPFTDASGHTQYLEEKLAEHLFKPDDLRKLLEGAVTGYLIRVRAIENQLLVQIRADLSEGELRATEIIPALQSQERLAARFQRLEDDVAHMVCRDLNVTLTREATVLIGSEVATQVAIRVGLAVAERLGVSAGILSAGAASSWATFGVGLVVAVLLDFAVDGFLHVAGHDPEGQVAAKMSDALTRLRDMIVAGVPEAVEAHQKLRSLQTTHAEVTVRDRCRAAADAIDGGGALGLRHELERLHEARVRVRREVLRRLILEQSTAAVNP